MGPKSQYTIIEQSNTLLKESLHIICPAWAPHTLLAALISIALLSSLILSLSSLASLLTSLAIILPRVMCANDECFVHRISGVSFTFRAHVTLARIQNLNGFSIGFFCSHSAHNVTLARIHRLPTSVGLAQARPNDRKMFDEWLNMSLWHKNLTNTLEPRACMLIN